MASVNISTSDSSVEYGDGFYIYVSGTLDTEGGSFSVSGSGSMSHINWSRSISGTDFDAKDYFYARNSTLGSGTLTVSLYDSSYSVVSTSSCSITVDKYTIEVDDPFANTTEFSYTGDEIYFLNYIVMDNNQSYVTPDSELSGWTVDRYYITIVLNDDTAYLRYVWKSGGTSAQNFTMTITEAPPHVTYPTIPAEHTYTGQSIQLMTAPGTTDHGRLEYSLNNSTWTSNYTNITGVRATTYNIYMRVIGNEYGYHGWGPTKVGTTEIVDRAYTNIYIKTDTTYTKVHPHVLTAINGTTYVWKAAEGYAKDEIGWHQLNHKRSQ